MDTKLPLILIVGMYSVTFDLVATDDCRSGSNNMYCPSKINHRYCVLGHFHVTDMWAEKSNNHIVWKFRMEKINLQQKSWWAAETSSDIPKSQTLTPEKAFSKVCDVCDHPSKQIYAQGWICMNHECQQHWKLNNGKAPAKLGFNDSFINERTPFEGFLPPYAIKPELPDINGFQSVTKQCWRGMICPECGRCNQRIDWDGFRCETQDCGFELKPPRYVVPVSAVLGDLSHQFQGHAISMDMIESDILECDKVAHGFYLIHDYRLPLGITITHGHSNGVINSQPGGADDVFRTLQEADIGLRRLLVQSPCKLILTSFCWHI